jgi:hypothetical protein
MEQMSPDSGRVANIGPRELRRRLLVGLAFFAVSVAIAAALMASHLHPAWRLALVFPLFVAALGVFQAIGKT